MKWLNEKYFSWLPKHILPAEPSLANSGIRACISSYVVIEKRKSGWCLWPYCIEALWHISATGRCVSIDSGIAVAPQVTTWTHYALLLIELLGTNCNKLGQDTNFSQVNVECPPFCPENDALKFNMICALATLQKRRQIL